MPLGAFAAMVQHLGAAAIQIRNDLPDVELTDGTTARDLAAAKCRGRALRSINARQRFERYDATRQAEARTLVRYAVESGTQALVLCPTNSRKDSRSAGQRHADLLHALRALQRAMPAHPPCRPWQNCNTGSAAVVRRRWMQGACATAP